MVHPALDDPCMEQVHTPMSMREFTTHACSVTISARMTPHINHTAHCKGSGATVTIAEATGDIGGAVFGATGSPIGV